MIEHQLASNYRLSLKALIYDEAGKLLLVKEKFDHWELPGGGPDHGETPEQALRREVMEELGVEIASFSPQPVFVWFFHIGSRNRYACWLVYEVVVSGDPSTTAHTSAVEFHDLETLTVDDFGAYFEPELSELRGYEPTMSPDSLPTLVSPRSHS
jgi:8-oxo-dGTP pyrophosphatase MutT (NUDIX family)